MDVKISYPEKIWFIQSHQNSSVLEYFSEEVAKRHCHNLKRRKLCLRNHQWMGFRMVIKCITCLKDNHLLWDKLIQSSEQTSNDSDKERTDV